jgi:hypothetical protein
MLSKNRRQQRGSTEQEAAAGLRPPDGQPSPAASAQHLNVGLHTAHTMT